MSDNENTWDKLLKIKTIGRDDSNITSYYENICISRRMEQH